MSKRNPLLPSTSRPFLFPRRQWWTACFLQPLNALTTSVCKHVSSRAHHRSRCGCSAVVCGDRLHKCWSVPLFVSSLFFFFLPWSCWDLQRRCVATGRLRRVAPPRVRHVTAADALALAFYNIRNMRTRETIITEGAVC